MEGGQGQEGWTWKKKNRPRRKEGRKDGGWRIRRILLSSLLLSEPALPKTSDLHTVKRDHLLSVEQWNTPCDIYILPFPIIFNAAAGISVQKLMACRNNICAHALHKKATRFALCLGMSIVPRCLSNMARHCWDMTFRT